MRKAKGKDLNTGIYARIRDVQMSDAERQNAVQSLQQAEQLVEMVLWMKEKMADVGHSFLKPSLKH